MNTSHAFLVASMILLSLTASVSVHAAASTNLELEIRPAQAADPVTIPGINGVASTAPIFSFQPNQSNTYSTVFKGKAYAQIPVILYDGTTRLSSAQSDGDGNFTLVQLGLSTGSHDFALYSDDRSMRKSAPILRAPSIRNSSLMYDNLVLPPTFALKVVDATTLYVEGQTMPRGVITLWLDAQQIPVRTIRADGDGLYTSKIPMNIFKPGFHVLRAGAQEEGSITTAAFSDGLSFNAPALPLKPVTFIKEDLNRDGRVNSTDLGLLTRWLKKKGFPKSYDLNKDGVVSQKDIDILKRAMKK